MQVETANAPATAVHGGQRFHFCSDHCREAFEENPDRYQAADRSAARQAR